MHPFFGGTMKQIKIGVYVNTHGLKGEVKVKPLTQFPQLRFQKGKIIHMQTQKEQLDMKIKQVREQKDMLLITFEGYEDINAIEQWKGSVFTINESDVHELEEDEAYYFELQDCTVYDPQGTLLGTVSEIIETGANAVLRVKLEERELLVPYVKAFVKSFDKQAKTIVVELLDGMI